jgi:hypothetical protein
LCLSGRGGNLALHPGDLLAHGIGVRGDLFGRIAVSAIHVGDLRSNRAQQCPNVGGLTRRGLTTGGRRCLTIPGARRRPAFISVR